MWREYGFVISSKYRKAVIFSLRERPKTPSEIALESKCNISHISRALRELSREPSNRVCESRRDKGQSL